MNMFKALGMDMCLELPSQKFFEPNEKFFECMKRFDKTIVDVGAGMGQVTKGLCERGHLCVGIDNNYREGQYGYILTMDAFDYPYKKDTIILVCRPNHSGWVEDLFEETNQTFIYVGLEHNLDIDLSSDIRSDMKLLASNVGDDGENMYLLRGCYEKH
ncbi:MAG: hypothetical protein CL489_08445 [Acidobacteria bacterium]|nr:hypothetical protein [Acidobacteriota bacterium]